jgi:4-amino-4-deoxy-L-arabinose transferase-like glycosyltransferase
VSRTTFRRLVWVLIAAATINAIVFMRVNSDRIVPGTDSPQYDLMARQLVADRGLTLQPSPPYAPTLYREPLYPLLAAAVYKLTDFNVDAVMFLQAVLLGLSAGLAAINAASLLGPTLGLLAGALFGLNSEVAHYAHWLLTEIPFTFVILLTLALALRWFERREPLDLLLAGMTLGLGLLVRTIAGVFVLPLLVGVALVQRGRRRRQVLLDLAVLLTGLVVVVTPWVVRNSDEFGHPAITSRFGEDLLRRAPRAAEPLSAYPRQIVASVWMMTNPLSQIVYPISRFQWGPSYEDNLIWDFHVNDMVRYLDRYQPVCEPLPDPDTCYAQIGIDFVRRYPIAYVLQTPFDVVTLFFAPLPGPQALIHNTLVWLSVGGALWLWSRRSLRREHWLLLGWIAAYAGASVVLDTQQRYLVPMLPIVAAFAAVLLGALGGWVTGKFGLVLANYQIVSRSPKS